MSTEPEEDEEDLADKLPGSKGTPGYRMADGEFEEARLLYERGEMGITEIAEKFDVSRQSLYKRFKHHGVKYGSKRAVVEAENAVKRFFENRTGMIEETRMQGFNALKQIRAIALKTAIDKIKSTVGSIGDVDDDMKTIARLNKVVIENVDASLRILRADDHVDEDALPSLIIEDLTDEEITEHHRMTGVLSDDETLLDLEIDEAE